MKIVFDDRFERTNESVVFMKLALGSNPNVTLFPQKQNKKYATDNKNNSNNDNTNNNISNNWKIADYTFGFTYSGGAGGDNNVVTMC